MRRHVSQKLPRGAHVRERMPYVPGPERPEHRLPRVLHPTLRQQRAADALEQLQQRVPVSYRHVVDARARFRGRECGEQARLDRVLDIGEVTAGLTVTVDDDLLAADHRGGPLRYHRRVGAFRVLAAAEDIEIAQPDAWEA